MARLLASPWLRLGLFLAIIAAGVVYTVSHWEAYRQSRSGDTTVTMAPGAPGRGAWPVAPEGPAAGAPPAGPGMQTTTRVKDPAVETADFFAEFRLNRERARGQELELLQVVLGNPAVVETARRDAQNRFLQIGRIAAQEAELENLLRARGYADALVSVSAQSAQVVVKNSALTPGQLVAVADLVRVTTGIRAEAVQVVTRER